MLPAGRLPCRYSDRWCSWARITRCAFRFDPEAQLLFAEWFTELESKVRGGQLPAALASHLAKYGKLMPVLAPLFELADRRHGFYCVSGRLRKG